NWDLGAVQTGEHKIVQRAHGVSNTDINKVTGSSVSVGGQSNVVVGGDLTAKGAQIDLGQGGTLAAKGNVMLGAASATSTVNSNSSGSDSHGSYAETLHTSDQALTGATLKGGDTVNIVSGKDITLSGSAISLDKGNANLLAAGDVNVGAATETHALNSHETHSHSNVVSGSKVASGVDQTATYSQGSMISADGVTVTSGRDINVTGSNIVGTNDVSLSAARDVNIKTSQDTIQSSTYFDKKETGLMSNGGLSVSVGSRSNSDKQQSSSVTNNGSAIGALNGNLTVSAGNDLHATGSILHAGNDVNLAGKTVKIDAATDTSNFAEQQQFRQAGVTVGVTNPVVAAVQTGRQMTNAAQSVGGDPRLIALAAATTGLAAKNTYDSLKQMGGDPVKAATSVGINVSVGASKNDSQMQARSNTAVGSTVSAGRNVTIAAAGAGKDSNIDVIGSTISAGNNAKLAAEGNVNLQAAENTSSQHSTNSGASASVGVSFTVGDKSGVAFTAGVAGNRGNADGDSSTWTNTHVSAGNEFVIQSGGDTNLKGAVASGKQVVADVGGNLNIESLQDKDHYDSKQQSAGISASVCAPPLCTGKSSVAGSIGQTKMNSDYASVIEQSGIKAGDGGFQVDVKGNTDLKGGVVASSDKAVQDNLNKLTTSTLTHSDIEDHASYDASSVGLSGGYGGTIGKDQKGTATNVNPVPGTTLPKGDGGLQVAPPVALSASGDANSTTRSGISGAAITIADGAKQQKLTGQTAAEAVSSINRDTSNTGSALAPIFDKDKIQAGFDITSQFINQAGTFVANRVAEADAAKAAANNSNLTPEQRAAAQQRADELSANWGPNGTYRQVLTALSVAAGGNVTGGLGQFAQNATVAYLQELGTNQVKQIADKLGSEEARAALHAIVGCAGAAASSQSCGAGAMGAATSSVLGSLLAPSANLSASEREARANLVASLVAGVAAVSGQNVATATGAGKIEVENNQVSPMAPVPGWLAGFKLPGYKGEQSGKGDGVIADPATALDSTIKPTGSLIYPMPDAKTVDDWITAIIPDQAKGLVDYIFTAAGGNKVFDTTDASAPPNMSPNGAGRSGAFNEAKRAAGIPVSQQPSAVYPNTDKRSNPQPGYQYEYTIPALGGGTQTVIIRDDADGHYFGEGNAQNRGPHFNDPAGNHYDY
ncbi:MAG: hemagglutinin repeat-containing protein, partial [Burkholderia gladioli]